MVKKAFVLHALAGLALAASAFACGEREALALEWIKGPYLQALGPAGVTIKVEVDQPSALSALVEGPGGERLEVASPELNRFHVIRVQGLKPATTYRYRVTAGSSQSDEGRFTTAPDPEKGSAPLRFIVYGDNRSDHAAHAAVVGAIEAVPSDFLIHTGDMVATGSKELEWRTFFGIERALLRDRCVFASVGNHELTTPDPSGKLAFLQYFASPARADGSGGEVSSLYSSFRWSNTRFFLLNAMDTWTGDDRTWLVSELARSAEEPGVTHRIAVLHHGPFSSGPHGNNARLTAAGVLDTMRKAGVGLVLSGHDHAYERGESEGLKYIVTGGGGAPLYARKRAAPEARVFASVHHFVEVAVDGEAVTTKAHRASGGVLDACSFQGRGGWDCGDEASGRVAAAGAQAAVQQASACGCELPGARLGEGEGEGEGGSGRGRGRSVPWAGAGLAAALFGRRLPAICRRLAARRRA